MYIYIYIYIHISIYIYIEREIYTYNVLLYALFIVSRTIIICDVIRHC